MKTTEISRSSSKEIAATLGRRSAPDSVEKRKQRWLRLAAYSGLFSFFLSLTAFNFVDLDIWHEMALIRESLRAGHLLTRDVFAYTPTIYPSVHHEWGAGLVAYALTHWFGGRAVLLLKYVIVLLIGVLCLRTARSLGADPRVWAILCPVAIYLSQFGFLSVIRAQAYTFLFAALCFWMLEQDRRGDRGWWIAWLCIFPAWVNMHGGFVVGLGLLALYTIERAMNRQRIRHLFLLLAASGIEVFINPYGPAYVRYMARALTMARPHIQEWRPVWAYGIWWTALFLLALAVATYGAAKSGIRRTPGLLMLAATAVEATLHCKVVPLFAIAWISYVPAYIQRTAAGGWITKFTERRYAFALTVWLLVTIIYLSDAVRWQFWKVRVPQIETAYAYPVGAVDYLKQQRFAGNVMVPFDQGAYVSWKLFPAVKVSLDSRYEVAYSGEWVDRVFRFYAGEQGWQDTLTAYQTDMVLVPRIAPQARVIQQSGWREVYEDREFEIYSRPELATPFRDQTAKSFSGTFP